MKKLITVFSAVAFIVMPVTGFAQTPNVQTLQGLLQQIQALSDQLKVIQQQKQAVVGQATSAILAMVREGSQGESVQALQALLASDPTLYPEGLITGFFGKATARAVRRFQERNGLSGVGFVGPQTLKKLNELLDKNPLAFEDNDIAQFTDKLGNAMNKDASQALKKLRQICIRIPSDKQIPFGWVKHDNAKNNDKAKQGNTNNKEQEDNNESDGRETNASSTVSTIFPLCKNLPPPTPHPTSTVDVKAPNLANISVSVGVNAVLIAWTTNEPATGQALFGTSSTYGYQSQLDPFFTINHQQTLSNLLPGTTYHYQVRSADSVGNLAASTDQVFTTVTGETTPPVVMSMTATSNSTTASVTWTTDEPATSKVFAANANPVNIGAAGTVSVSGVDLVTNHSLNLFNLSTSTTYFYLIETVDGFGNKATSTGMFVTGQ